ncbi:hypothetical protein NVP1197A_25 [Vibrio phage 1.197.A._10N.286.54.F2]|nr:hypothetical protein NVP1197A_25 [Vibrio phage 1.197.A._10N.286.54.F2]
MQDKAAVLAMVRAKTGTTRHCGITSKRRKNSSRKIRMGSDMCSPRKLTRREMLGFAKWKRDIDKEDINEFGEVVKRPISAYHDLYRIYLDKGKS